MTPNAMVMQACKIQYFIKLIAWDSKLHYMGKMTSFWTCLSSGSSDKFIDFLKIENKGVKWEGRKAKIPHDTADGQYFQHNIYILI